MNLQTSFLIEVNWKCICFLFVILPVCFPESVIPLDGEWLVQGSTKLPIYYATVPGNIYSDLLRNGTILNRDPYYRFNDEDYRWVSNEDWKFWRTFQVLPNYKTYERILLKCDGLDTIASIYINNKLVGTSDNQFRQYYFDIKDVVKAKNINVLMVRFKSPTKYSAEQFNDYVWNRAYVVPPTCPDAEQHGECHANFIRKAQSSFSWDWGPAFPTVGIWRNISIVAFNISTIEAVTVNTSFSQLSNSWNLTLGVHLLTAKTPKKGVIELKLPELNFVRSEAVDLPTTNASFLFSYNLSSKYIEKWWPNGYGNQKLYILTVSIIDEGGSEIATKNMTIGFRTMELVQDHFGQNVTGLTFYFRVNGIKIWAKGSNWIPAHALQDKVTADYVRWLLKSATSANMNILRVWGGGVYESDLFYQTCDELGILIWQDFMFACAMYPINDEFLATARKEVRDNVLRLQHHPSIAIWSANNENEAALVENWYGTFNNPVYRSDYLKLYIGVIRDEFLKYEIGGRPWVSSSPSDGKLTEEEEWISQNPGSNLYGDVHFYSYLTDPWDWTKYPATRFASEYGYQSWESIETLIPYSKPEDRSYYSRFANHRQHHPFGQTEMLFEISKHFRVPEPILSQSKFPALIYLTQINQAMGLKTETEYYRRIQSSIFPDSSGSTQGALYWQLNSIWPCPSWSSMEFGGKWKMAHYYAKEFFEPVLLSPYIDQGVLKVTLINDLLTSVSNQMTLRVFGFASGFVPKYSAVITVNQTPQSASIIHEENLSQLLTNSKCQKAADCFVVVDLGNQSSNPNTLFLGSPKDTVIPAADIKIADISAQGSSTRIFNVTLESSKVAPFVWIEVRGILGRFSKNGHTQYVANETLIFHSEVDTTVSELHDRLRVMSLSDIY